MTETPDPLSVKAVVPGSRWKYVERLKVCLEITAILIAGVWAYTRFNHDEAPSLELRADLGAKLGWEKVTSVQCQAEYEIQFQNIGKLPINVATTQLSVWYLEDPKNLSATSQVEYLDPMTMRVSSALYTKPNERFKGTYLPGEKDTEGFSFLVRNTPGKRMLFEIEIWSDSDAKKQPLPPPTWRDFHWDSVCGDQSEKQKAIDSKS